MGFYSLKHSTQMNVKGIDFVQSCNDRELRAGTDLICLVLDQTFYIR